MILPVVAYGDPVLKKVGDEIDSEYPSLEELIANMYETMYASRGVGLAAHQIGLPIRLFIVDCSSFKDEEPDLVDFKQTFINAEILEEEGDEWLFSEGCLSIPDVREEVSRKPKITLRYCDEDFKVHTKSFEGFAARVIQHEFDHTEGVLFTDYLSSLRRTMLKRKLNDIKNGNISTEYRMRFYKPKKGRR